MTREQAYKWYLLGTTKSDFDKAWRSHMRPIQRAAKAEKEARQADYDRRNPKCPKCGQNTCGQYHIGYPNHNGYCNYCTCKCK